VELAEKIKEKIKFIDKLRFLKTGSEACSAAVRIARAYKQEKRTYEEVFKMFEDEIGNRLPSRQDQEGRVSEYLQRVCSDISIESENNNDKKVGSEKICQNGKGNKNGTETLPDEVEKNKITTERRGLLLCSACERKTSTCCWHLQNLWGKGASSSSRLLESPIGNLVMPPSPCPVTQGFGIGTGYHGHHNSFIAAEYPGAGCVDEKYIKFDTIKEIVDFIRNSQKIVDYVIVEPVQLDLNVREDLDMLRKACDDFNIVLIFDEVITGFRTPKYCIAQYLDVRPDIICLGKAMANGYPLSVVGGQAKFMDAKGWFVSSTFASELSAIKEASTTIDFLTEERLEELWKAGAWFQKEFNKLTKKLQLVGIPTKAVFRGEELFKNIFWQEMCKKGYLMGKAWHIMFAHLSGIEGCTPLDKALETCTEVIKRIETQPIGLEGKMAQEVFKRY
jgi:acetylornithine/succinyldiaminopimelate/putrescine aminotransferase